MKAISIFILIFTAAHSVAFAQYREFTDKSGRTMRAKPVNVVGAQVRIEREDGHEFTVPVMVFSEEDQKYLQKWMLTFLAEHDRLLSVNAKGDGTKKMSRDSGSIEYDYWKGFYKITIENESDIALDGLKVDYRYFIFDDAVAADRRSDGDTKKIAGTAPIPMLGARAKIELETVRTDMTASKLAPGWYYTNGGDDSSKDKLDGIWIKIYRDDLLLEEYSDPTNLREKQKW